MKKLLKITKYLLPVFCLTLLFGAIYCASAETLSAKQLMLNKIKSSDFNYMNDLSKVSSGTASYEIKSLSGVLVNAVAQIKNLQDSSIKIDYKLNTPEKKLGVDYDVSLNKNEYKGDIYLDNDKLIMTKEVLSLIKEFDPELGPLGKRDLPQYLYLSEKSISQIWESISRNVNVLTEMKGMVVFLVEAIPEKYFTTSLTGQSVKISVRQDGLEDVLLSVLQKTVKEKERFAGLVADLAVSSGIEQNREKVKEEVLKELEDLGNKSDLTSISRETKNSLAKVLVLEELSYEASLLPSGQNKFTADASFNGDAKVEGKVTLNAVYTSDKGNMSGTYDFQLKASADEKKYNIDGQINGEFKNNSTESKSSALIKVGVKDSSDNNLLDLAIQINSSAKAEQGIQVNIPVLSDSNSLNIDKIIKNIPEVVLNGKPVTFDVDPITKKTKDGDRIMVPLRNLAEALGCEVSWVDPDQINISLGDTSISMFINKRSYTVNGVEKELDAAPFINGSKRTMVPLRFIAEELGCKVDYNVATNTVSIKTGE